MKQTPVTSSTSSTINSSTKTTIRNHCKDRRSKKSVPKMLLLQSLCRNSNNNNNTNTCRPRGGGGGGDNDHSYSDEDVGGGDNSNHSNNSTSGRRSTINKSLSDNATFHTAEISGCYSFRSNSSTLVSSYSRGTRIPSLQVFEHRRSSSAPIAITRTKTTTRTSSSSSSTHGTNNGSRSPSLLWLPPSSSTSSSVDDNEEHKEGFEDYEGGEEKLDMMDDTKNVVMSDTDHESMNGIEEYCDEEKKELKVLGAAAAAAADETEQQQMEEISLLPLSSSIKSIIQKSIKDLSCCINEQECHFYLARLTSLLQNSSSNFTSSSSSSSPATESTRTKKKSTSFAVTLFDDDDDDTTTITNNNGDVQQDSMENNNKNKVIKIMVQSNIIETLCQIMKDYKQNIYIQHMTLCLLGELGENNKQHQQIIVNEYNGVQLIKNCMKHHIVSPSLCLQASMTLYKIIHCLPYVNNVMIQLMESTCDENDDDLMLQQEENDTSFNTSFSSSISNSNKKKKVNGGNLLKKRLSVTAVDPVTCRAQTSNNGNKKEERLITIRKVMLLHYKHVHIQQYMLSILCLLSIMPSEPVFPSPLQEEQQTKEEGLNDRSNRSTRSLSKATSSSLSSSSKRSLYKTKTMEAFNNNANESLQELRLQLLQDSDLIEVIFQVLKHASNRCNNTSTTTSTSNHTTSTTMSFSSPDETQPQQQTPHEHRAMKQAGFISESPSPENAATAAAARAAAAETVCANEERLTTEKKVYTKATLPIMQLGTKLLHTLLVKHNKKKKEQRQDSTMNDQKQQQQQEFLIQTLIHFCQAPTTLCQIIQYHVKMTVLNTTTTTTTTATDGDNKMQDDTATITDSSSSSSSTFVVPIDNTLLLEALESLYVLVNYCVSSHGCDEEDDKSSKNKEEKQESCHVGPKQLNRSNSTSSSIICSWDLLLLNDATCRLLDYLEHIIRHTNTSKSVRRSIERLLYLLLAYEDV